MIQEKNRKCNICLAEKSLDHFDAKTYNCKPCESIKRKKDHLRKKIEERKVYREKLKERCTNDGITDEEFNKYFVPFEKFEIMKNLSDQYSFHQCSEISKLDKKQNKSDYENKYFLDVAFINDEKRNAAYRIHII